jgi:hypothetical protein
MFVTYILYIILHDFIAWEGRKTHAIAKTIVSLQNLVYSEISFQVDEKIDLIRSVHTLKQRTDFRFLIGGGFLFLGCHPAKY